MPSLATRASFSGLPSTPSWLQTATAPQELAAAVPRDKSTSLWDLGARAHEKTMAHSVGEVVEVLDASSGWLPARVLRRHEDGAYDVSVNLDETIHLGDAAALPLVTLCG